MGTLDVLNYRGELLLARSVLRRFDPADHFSELRGIPRKNKGYDPSDVSMRFQREKNPISLTFEEDSSHHPHVELIPSSLI